MDPETSRWAWGIAISAIFALIGIIFLWLRSEDRRLARNLHELRNTVQQLAIQIASIVRRK